MFGNGFTLRLAAAEARAAGGNLERDGNTVSLSLPASSAGTSNIYLQTFDKTVALEAG
jgi:hypothetical protein